VPDVTRYDNLLPAMIENGVGMVRRFLDGREALAAALTKAGDPQTWVTGTLFAPVLSAFANAYRDQTGWGVTVVPVVNHFFGEFVTVAGLLTVQDVLAALEGRELGRTVVLPEAMFRGPDGQSLDGQTREAVQTTLGVPVILVTETGRSGESARWSVVP
jgi:NifB/MoaA-like Fe-S oxidoreductase